MCCDCDGVIISLLRKISDQLEEIQDDDRQVCSAQIDEIYEVVARLLPEIGDIADCLKSVGLTPNGPQKPKDINE